MNHRIVSLVLKSMHYEAIIDCSDDAIISKTLQGIVTSWNRGAENIFGYTAEEMIGKPLLILFPPNRLDEEALILERINRGEKVQHFETERLRKDGKVIHVSATISPILDDSGRIAGASKIARDITDRKLLEQQVKHYQALVDSSNDAIISKTPEGIVTNWNRGAEFLFGYTASEMIGKPMLTLFPPGRAEEEALILARIKQGENVHHFETERLRKDGKLIHVSVTISPVRDENGQIVGASNIARDITERKDIEGRIRYLANHDQLTDLPNRYLFSDRLQQAMSLARRDNTKLALMYIDLDNFKAVNDTLGHNVGDLLLSSVSLRIRSCVRESDTVARLGGDELVALLPNVDTNSEAILIAEKILQSLKIPFDFTGSNVTISSSIGLAMYPAHGTDEKVLLKNADIAMYYAKKKGRDNVQIFDSAMLSLIGGSTGTSRDPT